MMERFITDEPMEQLQAVANATELTQAMVLCKQCTVSKDVMRYIAAVCDAARKPEKVRIGPSPRAVLALMRCCQALAAVRGRDYVIPDDVKELAEPVLAHRIVMRGMGGQADAVVRQVLETVPVPTEEKV